MRVGAKKTKKSGKIFGDSLAPAGLSRLIPRVRMARHRRNCSQTGRIQGQAKANREVPGEVIAMADKKQHVPGKPPPKTKKEFKERRQKKRAKQERKATGG